MRFLLYKIRVSLKIFLVNYITSNYRQISSIIAYNFSLPIIIKNHKFASIFIVWTTPIAFDLSADGRFMAAHDIGYFAIWISVFLKHRYLIPLFLCKMCVVFHNVLIGESWWASATLHILHLLSCLYKRCSSSLNLPPKKSKTI